MRYLLAVGFVFVFGITDLLADGTNQNSKASSATILTQQRLDTIIIPELKLEKASLAEALDVLRTLAAKNSTDGKGVNIVADFTPAAENDLIMPTNVDAEVREEILGLYRKLQSTRQGSLNNPSSLTNLVMDLHLRDIPLHDTLKLVTDLAGASFIVKADRVIVGQAGGGFEARVYKIKKEVWEKQIEIPLEQVSSRENGTNGTTNTVPAGEKHFFKTGPTVSSIEYLRTKELLIVIDTPENLDLFERVLHQLDGATGQ